MELIKTPLISVIVITFNRRELLHETLQSILSQSYRNFELIVIDNFSDYDFMLHIKTYNDSRIIAYQNQNNGIIAANRNYGIKKAKGEFIAFCDDDDLWEPTKLEKQINTLINCSDLLLVSSRMATLFKGKIKLSKNRKSKVISVKKLVNRNIIATSSVLVRKKVFDKIGYFDEKIEFRAVEDYDLWLRLLLYKDNSCKVLKDNLLIYRLHGNNISSNFPEMLKKQLLVFKKNSTKRSVVFSYGIRNIEKRILVEQVKYNFYNRIIGIKELFRDNTINIFRKIEILLKSFILKQLGNLN